MDQRDGGGDGIQGNYGWIPYHVVACSSEEYGCSADQLGDQAQYQSKGWESERLGEFPVEIVFRTHYRCELDYLVLIGKDNLTLADVDFMIGDGLSGNFNTVTYRLAGHADHVTSSPTQVKCQGIGNFIKISIKEKPKRSQFNPYSQVGLHSVRIWARATGNHRSLTNKFIELTKDKTRINKMLLEMGVSAEVLNWYEETDVDYTNLPIDEHTKVTLTDINDIREKFLEKEDFEAMKRITTDIKRVINIGRKIFTLQTDLEFAVAKQQYQRAIEIKEEIQRWERDRNLFDAKYETSKYEEMIAMNRPNSADYDDLNRPPEVPEPEEEQEFSPDVSKLSSRRTEPPPERPKPATPPSKPNVQFNNIPQVREFDIDEEERAARGKEAEGERDLDPYLLPLLRELIGQRPEALTKEQIDRLRKAGLLEVFGGKVWGAIYASNWKARNASARAVLNYISMPLKAKYIGKSTKLFLACIEIARMVTSDKVLENYYVGLKILTTCLKPPVCGDDIPPHVISKILTEFAKILIKYISELNHNGRDYSLVALLSIFRHQAANIQVLIDSCMDICVKEQDFVNFGRPLSIPIEKQQPRLVVARLEIIRNVLMEYGYKPPYNTWDYSKPFDLLLVPALLHTSNEVREFAVELALMMFSLIGEEIRQLILSIDRLKPGLYEELTYRMNEIENLAIQNTQGMDKPLDEIPEDEEELKEAMTVEPEASKSKKLLEESGSNLKSKDDSQKAGKGSGQSGPAVDPKSQTQPNGDQGSRDNSTSKPRKPNIPKKPNSSANQSGDSKKDPNESQQNASQVSKGSNKKSNGSKVSNSGPKQDQDESAF